MKAKVRVDSELLEEIWQSDKWSKTRNDACTLTPNIYVSVVAELWLVSMQDGLLFERSTRQLCKQDITICVCTWIVPYVRICMRFITVKNVDVVLLA